MDAWQKWRMCDRKKSFETRSKANKFAISRDMFVYECPICFCFHVTKQEQPPLAGVEK